MTMFLRLNKVWRLMAALVVGSVVTTLYVIRDRDVTRFGSSVQGQGPVLLRADREVRVDCAKLFNDDQHEMARADNLTSTFEPAATPDPEVTKMTADCKSFLRHHGFITSPMTAKERDFPIAFSVLVFKDAMQVLNLLRMVYRPQNSYCVHVDRKSPRAFRDAMAAIANCLPNVRLASRQVDVRWGEFSVLEPELVCMTDLWKQKSWKYFINLTGQEFPLRTNWELVQILKAFDGANSVEGTRKRINHDRIAVAGHPPGGILFTKGSVHVTVNRDFVDFVLHNAKALAFLNWTRQISVPDEAFFSSLNHNPQLGIRGSYKGEPESDLDTYPFTTRYKNWGDPPFAFPCPGGRWRRQICILNHRDLPLLRTRPELFANKFHSRYSDLALGCLAESLSNRTIRQANGKGLQDFDVSYYANLPFVRNHVPVSTFDRIT